MVEEDSTIILEESGSYGSNSPTISQLKEQLQTQKQITSLTIELSKVKEHLDQANVTIAQYLQHIELLRNENGRLKQDLSRLSAKSLCSPPSSTESHSWKNEKTNSIRNSLNFPLFSSTSAAESSLGNVKHIHQLTQLLTAHY
jgi:chromosome segregation ATPase